MLLTKSNLETKVISKLLLQSERLYRLLKSAELIRANHSKVGIERARTRAQLL